MTREKEIELALIAMVLQFAFQGSYANAKLGTGGLSALEAAFSALGLPDPCSENEVMLKVMALRGIMEEQQPKGTDNGGN